MPCLKNILAVLIFMEEEQKQEPGANEEQSGQPEDKEKPIEELCLCKNCPSYGLCKEETVYCLQEKGKSKCVKAERGCICGSCPVAEKKGLKSAFYCIKGSEEKQLAKP
jgi:hypothetical protein